MYSKAYFALENDLVNTFVRKALAGEHQLPPIFDIRVTVKLPNTMFFPAISITTTLREHFLLQLENRQIDNVYVGNIGNAIVGGQNPGRYFNADRYVSTRVICDAAYQAISSMEKEASTSYGAK